MSDRPTLTMLSRAAAGGEDRLARRRPGSPLGQNPASHPDAPSTRPRASYEYIRSQALPTERDDVCLRTAGPACERDCGGRGPYCLVPGLPARIRAFGRWSTIWWPGPRTCCVPPRRCSRGLRSALPRRRNNPMGPPTRSGPSRNGSRSHPGSNASCSRPTRKRPGQHAGAPRARRELPSAYSCRRGRTAFARRRIVDRRRKIVAG